MHVLNLLRVSKRPIARSELKTTCEMEYIDDDDDDDDDDDNISSTSDVIDYGDTSTSDSNLELLLVHTQVNMRKEGRKGSLKTKENLRKFSVILQQA